MKQIKHILSILAVVSELLVFFVGYLVTAQILRVDSDLGFWEDPLQWKLSVFGLMAAIIIATNKIWDYRVRRKLENELKSSKEKLKTKIDSESKVISDLERSNSSLNGQVKKSEKDIQTLELSISMQNKTLAKSFEELLGFFYDVLNFQYQERISYYHYSKNREAFIILYRHSLNDELKKIGRSTIDSNKGLMSRCKEKPSLFIDNLPTCNVKDVSNPYLSMIKQHDSTSTKTYLNALTMLPVEILIYAVRDSSGKHLKGFIVLESNKSKSIVEESALYILKKSQQLMAVHADLDEIEDITEQLRKG